MRTWWLLAVTERALLPARAAVIDRGGDLGGVGGGRGDRDDALVLVQAHHELAAEDGYAVDDLVGADDGAAGAGVERLGDDGLGGAAVDAEGLAVLRELLLR